MKKLATEATSVPGCLMCTVWPDGPTGVASGIAAGLHFGRTVFERLCSEHYDLFSEVDDDLLNILDDMDREACEKSAKFLADREGESSSN